MSEGAKNGGERGRPPFEPTDTQRQIVQVLQANGISQASIARNLSVDIRTLRKAFRDELRTGHDQVKAALGAVFVQAGLRGDWHAALEWLKRFGGPEWQNVERRLHEHVSDPSLRNVPDEELDARLAAIERKEARLAGGALAPERPNGSSDLLH